MTSITREKSVVIDPGKITKGKLSEPAHFVVQYDIVANRKNRDTFLILRTSTLNKFSDLLVNALKQLVKLRVVFLLKDDDGLDQFLDCFRNTEKVISSKILSMFYCVDSFEQINDVMNSWMKGIQNERIARAYVQDDHLIVTTNAMETIRVNFEDVPSLSRLPKSKRNQFVVAQRGRKLSWESNGIDVDMDIIRYRIDPKFRALKDLNALRIYSNLGDALVALREQHGLTQERLSARSKISTKQIGRFENGAKPTRKALHGLAKGFGMPVERLMSTLIRICDELQG